MQFKVGDIVRIVKGHRSCLGKLAIVTHVADDYLGDKHYYLHRDKRELMYSAGGLECYEPASMPNPGSDDALDIGCTCAVLDNAHGKGYMGEPGVFCMSADCPLHGTVLDIES